MRNRNLFVITIFKNKMYKYVKDLIKDDNNCVVPVLTENYDDAKPYDFLTACENRNFLNDKLKFQYNNYFLKIIN